MENLSNRIIVYLGRTPDFLTEIQLRDDGTGNKIYKWNAKDKPKPTQEQLEALETQTKTYEQELKDDEQTAINKKASAKQKLKDLGLDDEELKSMGL